MKDQKRSKEIEEKREVNKKLIVQALTDPKFRKQLLDKPDKALGKRISEVNEQEIKFVLAAVRSIEAQISTLADELLCANGGPCGIA